MDDDADYRALTDARGVAWVAERYVARLRRRLLEGADDDAHDDDAWVDDALLWGGDWQHPLPPETRLSLVVRAADAAADDDDLLWCIGDMPADHLVGDSRDMITRLHDARSSSRGVARMFVVMHAYLRSCGHDLGWWGDDSVNHP